MILRNTDAVFNLRCPRRKQETEAFHWIRKESGVAEFVTCLDFSYQRGFVVRFVVPAEWSSDKLTETVDRVCMAYHDKFMCDEPG